MKNDFNTISLRLKLLLFLLLFAFISDTILMLLSFNDYHFIFDTSGWNTPILINIIFVILIFFITRKKIIWLPAVLLFFWLIANHFGFVIMDWHYTEVVSPKGTETLIIKYRQATLGESHYWYEFYQKSYSILMKKHIYDDMGFIIYNDHLNARQALGIDHANWLNEEEVIFESAIGKKKIILY
ncbi:hypothetical protein [Paenibacillus sp. GCM10028914]|uniref:hypothetical protein n=1 Tax=Paenibacillus sp. GCM10028914 TaxID=3273416 RepID=UPI0036139015